MTIPKEFRGTLLTNDNVRTVFNLPFYYMVGKEYNLISHIQYCRAQTVISSMIYHNRPHKLNNNKQMFVVFGQIAFGHLKACRSNKLLRNYYEEHREEYMMANLVSKLTPQQVIDTALIIARTIEPQDDKEMNYLLGLLMEIRRPDILDFGTDPETSILSGTACTVLSYIGDAEYTNRILAILFPKWHALHDEDVILKWIASIGPIKVNIEAI